MQEPTWQVVAPVKGGEGAKSRLDAQSSVRRAVARALALDCLSAAVACFPVVTRVLVVSSDPSVLEDAGRLGARGVPERRPGSGLDAAVADGVVAAGRGPVAVLLADLPCLQPDDLTSALTSCSAALDGGAPSVFVPDADGTGTVLLAALEPAALRPAFGRHSAAAHAHAGAVRLELGLPRLQRDVDTVHALDDAVRLGVGRHTTSVLRLLDAASA